ncbi:MAG TPA: thiol-disulfide oxidoreductase DCC family protein [Pyrinomonadaceae bacterium]|nr:thiol-disulfide oxidoreductase DCC family protein [Pyrinomonadaceae bacterium]
MGAIVLFDGVCNFCNSTVNFIIEHDKTGYFKFAPLQSDAGAELADEHGLGTSVEDAPDSVILVENGKAFTHSTAALRIASHLGSPWSWLTVFRIVPAPIRDWIYKLFARYRYRLFGKKDQCMIPTPEVRERFL